MNNVCPECGGVLNSDRCQFCGAVIVDMASIDLNKPFFLKFKSKNDMVYRAKCVVDTLNIRRPDELSTLYYDDNPFMHFHRTCPTIAMELNVIPSNGIEFVIIDPSIAEKDAIRDVYNRQEDQNDS